MKDSIDQYVLDNGFLRIGILALGATITSIRMPDRKGVEGDIVAGFGDPAAYRQNEHYLGCVVGRTVNRIGGGRFQLDSLPVQLTVNDGVNHLHGGTIGFNQKVWELADRIHTEEEEGLVLEVDSPDGEEGYPGNLHAQVTYLLDKSGRLSMEYWARTDKPTPVNLTNHSYFNLSAFEQPVIDDHLLQIHAGYYTEKNGANLPSGRILPLKGTPLDFSGLRRIGDTIDQLPEDGGYDHNYVLEGWQGRGRLATTVNGQPVASEVGPSLAAELYHPYSGRRLRVFTDQPGIQLYTANSWDGSLIGSQGRPYERHGALALETQAFPDSPNHPSFPDIILRPPAVYRTKTIFEFSIKES